MNISRDVIVDLLPLYMAGEVSDATRALVDAYLREHPELAQLVQAGASIEFNIASNEAAPHSLEMKTLKHTRRRIVVQRWLFGVACFATALALGVEVTRVDGHLSGSLILFRYPSVMIYPLLMALGCWTAYYMLRRSKATDLS